MKRLLKRFPQSSSTQENFRFLNKWKCFRKSFRSNQEKKDNIHVIGYLLHHILQRAFISSIAPKNNSIFSNVKTANDERKVFYSVYWKDKLLLDYVVSQNSAEKSLFWYVLDYMIKFIISQSESHWYIFWEGKCGGNKVISGFDWIFGWIYL